MVRIRSIQNLNGVSHALNGSQFFQFPTVHAECSSFSRIVPFSEIPRDSPFKNLLLEGILVILISKAIRFLLKPLKQPRVVSEMIGGIIVGPSVLGRTKILRVFVPENVKFMVKNIGLMGFMFFLFVIGVKMDVSLIRKSQRKHWLLALFGLFVPLLTVCLVAYLIRPSMDEELSKFSSIGAVAASMAITGFFVLYPILQELNLLSSEVGRLALSTSIIIDIVGIVFIISFEAMKQAEASSKAASWYMVSVVIFLGFILTTLRRMMKWIVRKTPEGKPVQQVYVTFILMGVLVMGFLSDMFGMGIANGSLWLGLVIPDGPPLGSTIVETSEMIIMEVFMPFAYLYIGMFVDISAMISAPSSSMAPLFALAVVGYSSKIIATLLASLSVGSPLKDSIAFSFIMNLRGQLEYLLILHWMEKSFIQIESFTMMVLLSTAMTAIASPVISMLYDPSRPYMVSKRRTIQHSLPGTELKLVVCVNDEDSVAAIARLLEFSYATPKSPLLVYALHLIELAGRAAPLFVDHGKQEMPSQYMAHFSVLHALHLYQEAREEAIELCCFTAIVPERTMYQDICELAMVKEAILIVLPFSKEWLDNGAVSDQQLHQPPSVVAHVLDHAPCSIGILIHQGELQNLVLAHPPGLAQQRLSFILLFLGGADSREALAYADRMLMNPNVSITVIRFLPLLDREAEDAAERKLDDGTVAWFLGRNEMNVRAVYRQVASGSGEETLGAIRALKDNSPCDLWIMGRKQGINPMLLEGLSNWNEHPELGILGDHVSSIVSDCPQVSILVIQQQILRG